MYIKKENTEANGSSSNNNSSHRIHVLHVLGKLDPGGVETWLKQVIGNIDKERFQCDVLVHNTMPGAYDADIKVMGSKIVHCPSPKNLLTYGFRLYNILRGNYDVVHSHVAYFSAFVCVIACLAKVPVRITHSRNDLSSVERSSGPIRRLYYWITKLLIHLFSNIHLAITHAAGKSLFIEKPECGDPYIIAPTGIDFTPFRSNRDKKTIRTELNLPEDAFIIGHIGRFAPQKNHRFLVEILDNISQLHPNTVALLIGKGAMEQEIRDIVEHKGLQNHIFFLGIRSDIPTLMSAMDLFLFPSLFEGLGRVLIEAQAAGLPCIYSDVVPEEVEIVHDLCTRISLNTPPEKWAHIALAVARQPRPVTHEEALARAMSSPINILRVVEQLQDIYSQTASNIPKFYTSR